MLRVTEMDCISYLMPSLLHQSGYYEHKGIEVPTKPFRPFQYVRPDLPTQEDGYVINSRFSHIPLQQLILSSVLIYVFIFILSVYVSLFSIQCGVYMCQFAEFILDRTKQPWNFHVSNVPLVRAWMAHEVYTNATTEWVSSITDQPWLFTICNVCPDVLTHSHIITGQCTRV